MISALAWRRFELGGPRSGGAIFYCVGKRLIPLRMLSQILEIYRFHEFLRYGILSLTFFVLVAARNYDNFSCPWAP